MSEVLLTQLWCAREAARLAQRILRDECGGAVELCWPFAYTSSTAAWRVSDAPPLRVVCETHVATMRIDAAKAAIKEVVRKAVLARQSVIRWPTCS